MQIQQWKMLLTYSLRTRANWKYRFNFRLSDKRLGKKEISHSWRFLTVSHLLFLRKRKNEHQISSRLFFLNLVASSRLYLAISCFGAEGIRYTSRLKIGAWGKYYLIVYYFPFCVLMTTCYRPYVRLQKHRVCGKSVIINAIKNFTTAFGMYVIRFGGIFDNSSFLW